MLAKSWKKICLIILIIACVCNIVIKLSSVISFDKAINGIKATIQAEQNKKDK